MMWSPISNIKENINQIVGVVQDVTEEFENNRSSPPGEDSSVSDRRSSHRFAQSKSPRRSPISNGIDSSMESQIEKCKAEIQRLQTSEAELKALSINYAALLKEKEKEKELSEAEFKALSINYAALFKEKEGIISRLLEENGLLKKNLEATNASQHTSKNEKTLTSKRNVLKGASGDQSPSRQHRLTNQVNNHSTANHMHKNVTSKQDVLTNGSPDSIRSDEDFQGNENELADLLEEKNRSLVAIQANYDSEIKQLKMELGKERESLANIQSKLNEEQKLNGSFQKELFALKVDKDKNTSEMKELQNKLNDKISEIRRLQSELTRRDYEEEATETSESLKRAIATLEQENSNLKIEKAELEVALKMNVKSPPGNSFADDPDPSNNHSSNSNEVHSSLSFLEKQEMELSIQKLDKDLKEACQERDKALQELTRLKQHLLDKELEESDKMDEDSKIIEELRANCDYQRSQILHLEKALKQAIAGQEEARKNDSNELQKSKEMINDLKQRLASCISTIDAKNVELLNLQTALGQFYAESEAKERLEGDLALAREESAKFSELLKDANQRVEVSNREKDEVLAKLSQAERMLSEGKQRVHKLEEDNLKLRRALEQSMTRLNRMSVDSDYFVDRRIVIKLLVTYFQRNHSKEVLDLMVRMLGFSEEDKQRIGMAQQGAGKGVVRGVLGFPGRLVGGILGGSSAEASAPVPSDNQSFADLWVDFLLKETEERERRELMEATAGSKGNISEGKSSSTAGSAVSVPDYRTSNPAFSSSMRVNPSFNNQSTSPLPSRGNLQQHQPENSDTEFSTVPLTTPVFPSPESSSRMSRFLPRY
ncbi:hypothetical protein BVC80_8935g27 [Macleaya cordata]|uniref:GRIP n=1 Tax=Macleaya cordata TaxID=56857 RepID=A0A200R877_MACCD|nr:hypothetical protein BVC80_8935g27 [Macleaya cordata]